MDIIKLTHVVGSGDGIGLDGDGGAGLVCNLVGVDDGMRDDSGYDAGEIGGLVGSGVGIHDCVELANDGDIDDGLAFGPAVFVGVGLGVDDGVWLGDCGGIDGAIRIFGEDCINVGQMDGSSVRAGVGTGDGIGVGDEYSIAEEFEVCTVSLGSLFGHGNGIEDAVDVLGSLMWAGVSIYGGIRLLRMKGIAGGLGVGAVVMDCLFGLCDGIV